MNPLGQTKLNLMTEGVAIAPEAREVLQGSLIEEADGDALHLSLAEDFFLSAPVIERTETPRLTTSKTHILLESKSGRQEVGVTSLPPFLKPGPKNPVARHLFLDGYCLNLNLRVDDADQALNLTESEVLSAVRSASSEGRAHLVQLNMDFCSDEDRGFRYLEPLVKSIKRNFRTFISLRGYPPDHNRTLDAAYAAGVDRINFPLEGLTSSDTDGPPLERGHQALEYAAGVFPAGAVCSELLLNLSSPDLLFNKIDRITEKGVLPTLKLFGLPEGSSFEPVREMVGHLSDSVQRHKLPMKWLHPSGPFVSALDAPFYLDPPDTAKLAQRPVYQSTFGKTAMEGFAALRRALRVKNISDSYESAGL